MKAILIALLAIWIGVSSCGDYPCTPATARLSFVAFPMNELDTVVVRKFTKTSNFSTKIDSASINRTNGSYWQTTDTVGVGFGFGLEVGFMSTFDYEIFLPKVNRRFQITEIEEEKRSIRYGLFSMDKVSCFNSIKSYKVNGQLVSGEDNYFIFYFKK